MAKTKVLLLQEAVMLYRVPCWNILAEKYDFTIGYFLKDEAKEVECKFKKVKFDFLSIGSLEIVKGVRKYANNFDVVMVMPDFHAPIYAIIPFLPHRYKLLTWSIGFRVSYVHPYLTHRHHNTLDKIYEFILRRCDANIFYIEKSKEFWKNTKVDLDKVFVAPNTTGVIPATINLQLKNNFLFVGTLYRGKGVDILIKSFAEAKSQIKSDSQLDIIGGGEMLDELKNVAKDNGIAADINFIGPIYDERVLAPYFQKALLCISPTQGGLTCPKSMGYGVPFVTRKDAITGGEIYHMTPGINGIMYEKDKDLTDILIDALQNKAKYIKMGTAAKEYYDNNATPKHMAKGAIEAVEFVLNSSRDEGLEQ